MKSLSLFLGRSISTLVLLALVLGLTGCPTPRSGGGKQVTSVTNPDLFSNEFRRDDRVIIIFSGTPQPPDSVQARVRQDGTVSVPLIGSVLAEGLTPGELQESIHTRMVPDFYKRLTVTVQREDRYFFVGGEVRLPSRYPYVGEMTVLRAISTAGGFTKFADKKRVQITRNDGRTLEVNCREAQSKPSLDLPIYPGDKIQVDKRLL